MEHYSGQLGSFDYDPGLFQIQGDNYLHYIGSLRGGMMRGSIPPGISDCSFMFAHCKGLRIGPILPKSCRAANGMFDGCSGLEVYPDINLALMESETLSVAGMFHGCKRLQELSIHKEKRADGSCSKAQFSVYVCACMRSADYSQHVRNMEIFVSAENRRRIDDFRLLHPLQYRKLQKRYGEEADLNLPLSFLDAQEQLTSDDLVAFDYDRELVALMRARNAGDAKRLRECKKSQQTGTGSKRTAVKSAGKSAALQEHDVPSEDVTGTDAAALPGFNNDVQRMDCF